MMGENCTEECERMPECAVCHRPAGGRKGARMRIACQVMAAWRQDDGPGQKSSRVYVERRDDGTVALRLPGQGEMRLSPGDAMVVGSALVEVAEGWRNWTRDIAAE